MKTIDATLLSHKARSATTLTDLLLVGPLEDSSYRGFTELDKDVPYTPSVSIGEITFKSRTAFEMSALESTNDMGVGNAEAESLQPIEGHFFEGFTQAQIDAGALDKVRFVVLRIDYTNLSGQSEVISGGTIGEVRLKVGGMTVLELRSLSQQLRQKSIVELDSLTCRARFGSQPLGSGGGEIQERFPCEFDAEATWVSGTVTSVGAETDIQFADTSLVQADDYFAPGKVVWDSGDNVGQMVEVETFASTVVELKFPTVSPIQVGDTYRIRRQCTKRWTGHNSCETFWAANKTLHFRGEPHIPVGQSGSLSVPGAGTPTGIGGGSTA